MLVDIDDEQVPKIVAASLKDSIHTLGICLEQHKQKNPGWVAIFSTNKKEDIKKIKEMREALTLALSWYSTGEDE